MELLEVKDISKNYGSFALEHISFTLPKGYIMGYVGQNGAGKTTTLNLVTNICKADSGEVWIDGIKCMDDSIQYKESIGYIGDEFYFPANFTVKNIRRILKNFYRSFQPEVFDCMVKKWNLPEKKKLADFSRGMKVKLMFASVFARETKLLILDEATNGLDPVGRSEVLRLLQEYIADGEHSVLFSTHILSDLEQIADYIYFIHDGRTILYDAKDELLENYMLVKGNPAELTQLLREVLIGITCNAYGFEAILPSDRGNLLTPGFLYEKPNIDQLVIHFIKEKEAQKGA